jgi:two-component system response regulator PilR (NtrC family)
MVRPPNADPTEPSDSVVRARVLVVDDDETTRRLLQRVLGTAGYAVESAATGEEGLVMLGRELYDLALLDLQLPGLGGMELLAAAPAYQTDAQFIVMTGEATVDRAIEAMKLGAYDFLRKPLHMAELQMMLERALEERDRRREMANLRLKAGTIAGSAIVGKSATLRRMFDLVERVAPTRATVLITGETGTGKELVAQTIHALSERSRKPFVAVNCSALAEGLLESELFGHMKGSFTGAIDARRGLFEEAGEGTLFLDEVGAISAAIQVKLLRVLQERRIQRVGGSQTIPVAFRLVAATNVDLAGEVAAGRFREDLYYRLNVFPIQVPPLRERRSDIPLLAAHFRNRYASENGLTPPELAPDLIRRLIEHDWPGNVRELENFIERAVIMHAGARRIPASDPGGDGRVGAERSVLERGQQNAWTLEQVERDYILRTLEALHWHQGHTADRLGIDRRTLYRKLHRYQEEGLLPGRQLDHDTSSP